LLAQIRTLWTQLNALTGRRSRSLEYKRLTIQIHELATEYGALVDNSRGLSHARETAADRPRTGDPQRRTRGAGNPGSAEL